MKKPITVTIDEDLIEILNKTKRDVGSPISTQVNRILAKKLQ
jgi:hypothetical protein